MQQTTIYFFPFAGGNKYSYNPLIKELDENLQGVTLEYPGHGLRFTEPLLYDIHQIVDDLLMKNVIDVHKPYLFFGHSLGALVAYLIMRKLAGKQLPMPMHAFLTGCPAPAERKADQQRYLLPDDALIKLLNDMGGVQNEDVFQNADMRRLFLPILRADFQANDSYVYKPDVPTDVPLTIITGTEEKTMGNVSAWQNESTMPVTVHKMKGDHFFIFNNIPELAGSISEKAFCMQAR